MKENIKRIKEAQKVTIVEFIGNSILCLGKLIAGIGGRRAAMSAAGVHSRADLVTAFICIVLLLLAG